MIIIEISGGLGNQMFQYALGQKFISMGKEVKYDLSFYNDRVQTLRQFELDIFDLDCPVASNSELSRFGKGNSLKSRLKQMTAGSRTPWRMIRPWCVRRSMDCSSSQDVPTAVSVILWIMRSKCAGNPGLWGFWEDSICLMWITGWSRPSVIWKGWG